MIMSNNVKQQHAFHMVTASPWPMLTSFSILSFFLGIVVYLHYWRDIGFYSSLFSLFCIIWCLYCWFSDIIKEAKIEGNHTKKVYMGLSFGMVLFMTSEVMFFFAFFWAFFHSSLIPSVFIGAIWPPLGIIILNPWGLPFLNTIFLLTSGMMVTWSHRGILADKWHSTFWGLILTILLGIIFTCCQLYEYIEATFTMNSSIYGSIFFLATGFHGFHVLVGTIFLSICLLRMLLRYPYSDFNRNHHFGFEAAMWYWHFVDVVWLFLFTTIYWWGS